MEFVSLMVVCLASIICLTTVAHRGFTYRERMAALEVEAQAWEYHHEERMCELGAEAVVEGDEEVIDLYDVAQDLAEDDAMYVHEHELEDQDELDEDPDNHEEDEDKK